MPAPGATMAATRPSRTTTTTEMATPAEDVLMASPPARASKVMPSDASTSRLPLVWTMPPTDAAATDWSPALKTRTMIEPSTAALELEPAASTARSVKFSLDVALTLMSPAAETVPAPIEAETCLVITSTTRPTPTPAPLLESESVPARFVMWVVSSAVTLIVCEAPGVQPPCGCWLTCAPAAIYAVVVKKSTSTITEPDTAAPPPEMPPASATDESWGSVMTGTIGAGASTRPDLVETVSPPSASTCVMWMNAPESMNASVVTSGKTLTTMAPPTAVLPDEPLPARARF